jgi:hypothetical protein
MKKVTLLDCFEELPDNLDILIHLGNGTYCDSNGGEIDSISILVENTMESKNIRLSNIDMVEYFEIYDSIINRTKKLVFNNWMADNLN